MEIPSVLTRRGTPRRMPSLFCPVLPVFATLTRAAEHRGLRLEEGHLDVCGDWRHSWSSRGKEHLDECLIHSAQCCQSLPVLIRAAEHRGVGFFGSYLGRFAQCCQSLPMLTRAAELCGAGERPWRGAPGRAEDAAGPHVVRDTLTIAPSSLPSVASRCRCWQGLLSLEELGQSVYRGCVAQRCQSLPMLTRAAEYCGPGRSYGEGHLAVRDVWSTRRAAPRLMVGPWRIAATAVSCRATRSKGSARRFLLRRILCRWLSQVHVTRSSSLWAHCGIECAIKINQKDLNSAESETVTTSKSPTTVITANGEVQTNEEAIVYVKRIWKNSWQSLGKLCDKHGHSYERINGQKPHLIKNGIRIQCNTENFVPVVVPGLSASSSSSLPTSTPMTPSTEIDHSDHPPAIVSSERVERQERWDPYSSETSEELLYKPTKNPKTKKMRNTV